MENPTIAPVEMNSRKRRFPAVRASAATALLVFAGAALIGAVRSGKEKVSNTPSD